MYDVNAEFDIKDCKGSFIERFDRITALFKDKIAVHGEEGQRTYGEVMAASVSVAALLKNHFNDRPVALLMDHDIDLVGAMLGWGSLADQVTVIDTPGIHGQHIKNPNAPVLAKALADACSAAESSGR